MTRRLSTLERYGPFGRTARAGSAVAMLTLALLAGCTVGPDGSLDNFVAVEPSARPVTVDAVKPDSRLARLAAEQHPKIVESYGGAYSDPKLERMVARVVGQLTTANSDVGQIYRITILDSPSINAFALPGGYLYLTRGLLALANDGAELATVIAHEMAHVTADHGQARQRKEQEETIATQVAEELLRGNPAARAAAIRGQLRLAQFSRNQELEADAIGIRATAESGFDPYAAGRFLRSMTAYTQFRTADGEGGRIDFLATHPASERRMVIAQRLARTQGGPGVGDRMRDAYLDGIDGLLFGDRASDGYIRGRNFLHPELGIAFTVPDGFILDNSDEAVTASGPDEAAIRFDGIEIPAETSLTGYLKGGWVDGLDQSSIQVSQRGDIEIATARATVDGWGFAISLFRFDGQAYRILTAAPQNNRDFIAVANEVTASFRRLQASERASLKPLRIVVTVAQSGDTVASLARRIEGTDRKEELLRLLNGLGPADSIRPGDRIKLVAER